MLFPLGALFATLFAIYWAEGDVRQAEDDITRAHAVRDAITAGRSALLDAETATAGYFFSSDPSLLAAFADARGRLEAAMARLPGLAGGDPQVMDELRGIADLAARELRLLDEIQHASASARTPLLAESRSNLTTARDRLDQLNQYEERQFSQARSLRDLARRRLFGVVMVSGVAGTLGALLIHLLIAGRLVRRIRLVQENARRLALGLPLAPPVRGSDEIAELGRQVEEAARLLEARDREVNARERRYRELFDQAPVPYEETDLKGVVRHFNQAVCDLLKTTPDRLLAYQAWEFVAPDRQETMRLAILERLRTGIETPPYECEYLLRDGSSITVEIRENFIRDDGGETTGLCRSLLDVTERNLAIMAARKVEQYALELRNRNEQLATALDAARSATIAKSRFLAAVSHELRTPLNSIIGFSELLHDGKVGPINADHRECLADILTSARHLLGLINDILDLSKVEAGKMEFLPEHSHLETLLGEVRDVIRPLAEKKHICLATSVEPGMEAILDRARFKQVLYNYLSNAVKFTPNGGAISVRILPEGHDYFRLEVEDTGTGIAPEELGQLFQEFQQLPGSRKAEQGTGLGLALTRRIVEAQGGRIAVSSVEGKGSVFSAVLPLQQQETQTVVESCSVVDAGN